MNTFHGWGNMIFAWILQTTWHAAVLAVLILLAQGLFARWLSPGWRYGLWLLLVVRLVMPVSPPSTFSIFNVARFEPPNPGIAGPWETSAARPISPTATEVDHGAPQPGSTAASNPPSLPIVQDTVGAVPPRPTVRPESGAALTKQAVNWHELGYWIWLAGAGGLGLRLVWTNLRFRSRIGRYLPVAEDGTQHLFENCREVLGIAQPVILIETDAVTTPAVHGLCRKRLLLPDGIFERFNQEELRHIFLHELAHLKRRDLEIHWLVAVLQVLHWFNPALWLAFRRMRADRELATDALALSCAKPGESTAYGETILKVLEGLASRSGQPELVGIVEDKMQMRQRMREIARHGGLKPWKWVALGIFVAVGGLALTDATKGGSAGSAETTAPAPPSLEPAADRTSGGTTDEQPRHFALRIVDFDSAAPLGGVRVKFEFDHYSGPSKAEERPTGTDGVAAIDFETSNVKHFGYRTEKAGYLSLHGDWYQHQTALLAGQLEIKLSQGTEIGGTVVDEKGNPIPGAEIYFDHPINMILSHDGLNSMMWSPPAGLRLAGTDGRGNWRAKCIWQTVRWAALRIRHPNFADAVYSTEITKAMEAEGKGYALKYDDLAEHRAKFTLRPGVSVTGKVIDATGAPIPGIQVRYADRPSENPYWDQPMGKATLTTDAGGQFRIDHLPQKRLYFTVQQDGSAPTVAEFDLAKSKPEIELRLKKGQPLRGHVTDSEGHPIVGARLTFQDWSIWQGVRWESLTDDRGRFQWNDAPAGKFQLLVEKAGFITQRKIVQDGAEQGIRLRPMLNIVGKVVDAETQKPIDRFRVVWADRPESLQFNRRFAFPESSGRYSLDLGRIYGDGWSDRYLHEFIFRIEAEGYLPVTSRNFSSNKGDLGVVYFDTALQPVSPFAGTVVDAEGRPVTGAQLALKTPTARLRIAGRPQFENLDHAVFPFTDAKGGFRVSKDPEASHLIVVHERGIASVEIKALTGNATIRLQPWGRIGGTVWEYDRTLPNQEIWISSQLLNNTPGRIQFCYFNVTADSAGHFVSEFVPPSKCSLYRMIPAHRGGGAAGAQEVVLVKPGETTQVRIGGRGRPIIGRFKIQNPYVEIDWRKDYHSVSSVRPRPPDNLKGPEAYEAWQQREDIQRALDAIRHHPIQFSEDGSFRIDEMIPGKYEFSIMIYDPRDRDALAYGRYIANYHGALEVPVTADQNSRHPLDLGVFELALKPQIEEGKTAAPEFVATDMNGKEFKLSDFKRQFVLLDFWATWCGPCIAELPYLRNAYERFRGRTDFVMVSLSLDKTLAEPRDFVKKNDMPWRQGYLGDWSKSPIPTQYGVDGIPAIFLVNPEGKIIAKGLGGGSLSSQLEAWLK